MSRTSADRPQVTRDHIFSFAAWLLWQRATTVNSSGNEGIKPAYLDVFERFFALFPAQERNGRDTHSLYASLASGADPEKVWQFVTWLHGKAKAGPGLNEHPQGANWGYARNWSEFKRIVKAEDKRPSTAVLPNPWTTKVTPKEAWEALKALRAGRLGSNGLILEAAIEQWRRATLKMPYHYHCPACSSLWFNPLIASHHLPRCPSHPAMEGLRAANDLLQVAPVVAKELGAAFLLAVPYGQPERPVSPEELRAPVEYNERDSLDELKALVAAVSNRAEPLPTCAHLEVLLTEWSHLVDRATDPCPHCDAVVELDQMIRHLLDCPSHPARVRAAEITGAIVKSLGEDVGGDLRLLVTWHNGVRDALRMLSQATEAFAGNLHWGSDTGAYSKSDDEEPWRAAMGRAASPLSHGQRPSPASRVLSSPTAARLLSESEGVETALRQLLDSCRAYWNGMREGEGGRSIENRALVPAWEAARKAALQALGGKESPA